jgi:hypothetical protein
MLVKRVGPVVASSDNFLLYAVCPNHKLLGASLYNNHLTDYSTLGSTGAVVATVYKVAFECQSICQFLMMHQATRNDGRW